MRSFSPLMLDALVDCVATGREPTVHELAQLADRVWSDASSRKSAFSWSDSSSLKIDRVIAFRAALLAFRGSGCDGEDAGCFAETRRYAASEEGRANAAPSLD